MAERLDAGGVAKIEAVYFEAICPLAEVGLPRIPRGGVSGKPRRDDEMGARPQQFESGLIADFDPASGEQGHAAAQVRELGALREVQSGAARAHLIVEVVNLRVLLFANVTVREIVCVSFCPAKAGHYALRIYVLGIVLLDEVLRRKNVGGVEYRLPAQRLDARRRPFRQVVVRTRCPAIARGGFCHSAPLGPVGMVDLGDGLQEPLPLFGRQPIQDSAIGGHHFEQFGCVAQAVGNLG